AALQSPGLSKAFCPSTALKPAHRARGFGKCPISPEFSSDSGSRFRAFDSRPVSCHVQPSVVSLQRRRDMLCSNDVYTPTLETESPVQPGCKSGAKGDRDNNKPCTRRDHNHTNPEYVWGDEGPMNERQEASKRTLQSPRLTVR